MWRPFGTRRNTTKSVDPISLVSSAVREREAKLVNNTYRTKAIPNINIPLPKELKTSNKTFGLHDMVHNLSKDDYLVRVKALRDLPELLENPLYAGVAIELNIVERLAHLQKRYGKKLIQARANEESLILHLFQILSRYEKAAPQIAAQKYLISSLYNLIRSMNNEQHVAAAILKNLSENQDSLQVLMKIPHLLRQITPILQRELCTIYYPEDLWRHLQHVLDANPDKGVQEHFMDTFLHRIKQRIPDYHLDNMKCLGILLKSARGKSQFQASEGVRIFYEILRPKKDLLSDYEPTLEAFKNALYNNPSLVEDCSKFPEFPEVLASLAKITTNPRTQLLCFYILNYFSTREEFRHAMLHTCRKMLLSTTSLTREAEFYKLSLKSCLHEEKKLFTQQQVGRRHR